MVKKISVSGGQDPADGTREPAISRDKEKMNHRRSQQDGDARAEEGRQLNGFEQGENPDAQGDADVGIAHLRGVNDLGPFRPAVINGEDGVWQHREPAAQPTHVFGADETRVNFGNPIHQPIGADVNGITANSQQNEIERQRPAQAPVLSDIILEDIEDMEALPKEEETHQHKAVGKINFAIRAECPGCACKKRMAVNVSSKDNRFTS